MNDMINTVIFDLDGTLLDTLSDLAGSVNAALKRFDLPQRTLGQVRSDVGNGIKMLMIRSVPQGEKNPHFNEILDAFRDDYKENCMVFTKPYDGIIKLLGELSAKDCKIAIVSNKADFAVSLMTKHYFGDFSFVAVGERDGIRKKPAPDMVFQALKELGSDAEHSVFVGDSDVDIKTASAAGMKCISVSWGFRSESQLISAGAAKIISSPDMLIPEINP